jgi:hypothetical protein
LPAHLSPADLKRRQEIRERLPAAGLRSSDVSPTATGSAFIWRPTATPPDLPLSTWYGWSPTTASRRRLVIIAKIRTTPGRIPSQSSPFVRTLAQRDLARRFERTSGQGPVEGYPE